MSARGPEPDSTRSHGEDDDTMSPSFKRVVRGDGAWGLVREIAITMVLVGLIAVIVFAISGVWPPLVAVESDSMEEQIMTGDLVFIVENDRFVHEAAIDGTGVVPADIGAERGYRQFSRPGDVIIYAPNGEADDTPIIHRAHLWVEAGEDWTTRAHPQLLGPERSCAEIAHCPAPHDGFITRGDNNPTYDQIQRNLAPVKPEWVLAKAKLRIPILGYVRLIMDDRLQQGVKIEFEPRPGRPIGE